MARRNGYTDHTEPMAKLRKALGVAMRGDCSRMSREDLVKHGVEKMLNKSGLFAQYENEFKGYIVSNAISMAEGDVRAAGVDPVRGTSIPSPKGRQAPEPEIVRERAALRLQRSQAAVALIEKRALVKIVAEFTFHQLWELGNDLGKKDDHRPISQHATEAQLSAAGVEIIK